MLFLIFLYALSASSFTIGRAIFSCAEPTFFLAVRFLITGAGTLLYCAITNPSSLVIKRKDFFNFGLIIVIHAYIAFLFELWALRDMTSFKGAFLLNLSPFISALISYFYFSERLNRKKWLGLIIGFLGFMPEIMSTATTEVGGFFFLSQAEIMMIISVVATVYGWILMRMLIKEGYSPLIINSVGMLGGAVMCLITSVIVGETWNPFPVFAWKEFSYLTGLIIVLNDVAFYNLYGYLLKRYTATFMAFAGFLCPLIAALFGWLFLQETVSWHFFVSLVIVFIGLSLYYNQEFVETEFEA